MNKQTKALLKENNRLEKELDAESIGILTDIVVYLRGASISEYHQELARRDITLMLIDGQKRGQGAAEVIGEDYKAFCESITAEMPKLTVKDKILSGLEIACKGFGLLLLIFTLFSLAKGDASRVVISFGDIITAVLIVLVSSLVVIVITRRVFEEDSMKPWARFLLIMLVTSLCIMPSLLIRKTAAVLPTITLLIIVAVLLGIYKALDMR